MAGRARRARARRATSTPPRGGPSRERPAAVGHASSPTRRIGADRAGARDRDQARAGGRRGGAHPGRRGREARPGAAGGGRRSTPTRATPPTWRSRSAATARSSPRCATTPVARSRCSPSTTARSGSWPRSSRTSSRRASRHALAGGFDVMNLPVLVAQTAQGEQLGVNDLSFHRRQSGRVAELAYSVDGHEPRRGALRRARGGHRRPGPPATTSPTAGPCSRGAWRASWCPSSRRTRSRRARSWWRPTTCSRSRTAPRSRRWTSPPTAGPPAPWPPRRASSIRLRRDSALLAQPLGATFYTRLRDKFGRLSF